MSILSDIRWKLKYTPEDGELLEKFYIPALSCAVRYDRSTGYFGAAVLAAASRGVEGLVRNEGRMRLIVGCTLGEPEAQAIAKGESLKDTVESRLLKTPLSPVDSDAVDALELLAWMVAKGYLEVKVAVPCDAQRRPVCSTAIYHEKAGVVEDKTGDRIAFNGSVNESANGWRGNFESFHVFLSWKDPSDRVEAEEESFGKLWADHARTALVVDVPSAIRDQLLAFLPEDNRLPRRLQVRDPVEAFGDDPPEIPEPGAQNPEPEEFVDPRKVVWSYIYAAPSLPDGGERTGEATCPIVPWPHQVRAFHRMYDNWPPRLLIADEVGLGKTIQAGMLLRQAYLAGRARRILVLAPKAVLNQWQIELREKFNLNWPIYDGKKLLWFPSPALRGNAAKNVDRDKWHEEPCVLASSHLMRRRDRARELLEDARPWDLVILDEAHHARRRGGGIGVSDDRPNRLLNLMLGLKDRTDGLVLLTATPMQVSPVEVRDLLDLFGLPEKWHTQAFLEFFEYASMPMPGNPELASMASMFRAVENAYGEVALEDARKYAPKKKKLKAKKILNALRDASSIPLRRLETDERRAAVRLMKANTPIKRLISRHTRDLLRRYDQAGKVGARIAVRKVEDRFVDMTEREREVYKAVEDYISSTYNNAAAEKRSAVGFVMTVYRRRLASSFFALARTLQNRMNRLEIQFSAPDETDRLQEDLPDDELSPEVLDADDAAELETQALALEEKDELETLLRQTRRLPADTKTNTLLETIESLKADGFGQVMVFTQFTDTLDYLRSQAAKRFGTEAVLCFSGRGGEIAGPDGKWRRISRDDAKARFRDEKAEIMLCTDAAAEGLNFQFCGALINYDMPWNPMKVEQRIGRIDRVGQRYDAIRIVNLHYEDTVETDVYRALRERIDLFTNFVGKLQPILAKLPGAISEVALAQPREKEINRLKLVSDIASEANELDAAGFDLDEAVDEDLNEPDRPEPLYSLRELDRILSADNLLPPGVEAEKLGSKDYTYLAPGMKEPVRVTADPEFFDAHPESTELWSPGGPLFPEPENMENPGDIDQENFFKILYSNKA